MPDGSFLPILLSNPFWIVLLFRHKLTILLFTSNCERDSPSQPVGGRILLVFRPNPRYPRDILLQAAKGN